MMIDRAEQQSVLARFGVAARGRFAAQGWPNPKAEAWKFTDLKPLRGRSFCPASGSASGSPASGSASGSPASGSASGISSASGSEMSDRAEGSQIVFDNGIYQATLTDLPDGIELVNLDADDALAELLNTPHLHNHPVADQTLGNPTSAIGLRITGVVETPLSLIFRNNGDDTSTHPLLVIDLAEGAALTLLESHHGTGAGLSLPLMALRLGRGARLNHARIQSEGEHRHHLAQTVFTLADTAQYRGVSVQTGASLSRSENHFALDGTESHTHLTTLYLARQNQVMDTTASVSHNQPSCTSMQVIRGVLDDKAKGIFQGKVLVAPDAQHTDGNQMSRALLLSRQCEANAKPELEIYADAVACSHGATVGEIESDLLFYLMSRGIAPDTARQMLVEAFLTDALEGVGDEVLCDFIAPTVRHWLEGGK